MKLRLIDENLPEKLILILGSAAVHSTQLGARLSDHDLWLYARERNGVIVTKDADFFERLAVEGTPPKVVWIRTGSLRRIELETLLARV